MTTAIGRDGGDLREQDCEQQGEQRPESVGGSPELLGEECAVNGDQEDGGNKGLQRGICSELLRAKAPDGERGREDEDMGPEREELAGAVVRVGGEGEGGDGVEERGGEEDEGDPTASHPIPVAVRPGWGTRTLPTEEDKSSDGGGKGPEQRSLAVGGKHDREAGQAALPGEGDGPVEVIVQADGGVDGEECGGERDQGAGEEPEFRGDAVALPAACDGDG